MPSANTQLCRAGAPVPSQHRQGCSQGFGSGEGFSASALVTFGARSFFITGKEAVLGIVGHETASLTFTQ